MIEMVLNETLAIQAVQNTYRRLMMGNPPVLTGYVMVGGATAYVRDWHDRHHWAVELEEGQALSQTGAGVIVHVIQTVKVSGIKKAFYHSQLAVQEREIAAMAEFEAARS